MRTLALVLCLLVAACSAPPTATRSRAESSGPCAIPSGAPLGVAARTALADYPLPPRTLALGDAERTFIAPVAYTDIAAFYRSQPSTRWSFVRAEGHSRGQIVLLEDRTGELRATTAVLSATGTPAGCATRIEIAPLVSLRPTRAPASLSPSPVPGPGAPLAPELLARIWPPTASGDPPALPAELSYPAAQALSAEGSPRERSVTMSLRAADPPAAVQRYYERVIITLYGTAPVRTSSGDGVTLRFRAPSVDGRVALTADGAGTRISLTIRRID